MTYAPFFTKSSMKSDILQNKAGVSINGTMTAHFDKTQLLNTDVTCSNDYQFVLSSSSGSSFILEGGLIISSSSTSTITFQWYDETNSQFIGYKGFLASKTDPNQVDPWYNTLASCVVLSSDFGGSDITVSLRAVSETGSATYPATLQFNNTRNTKAVLRILQN